jgi:hypothetical protein
MSYVGQFTTGDILGSGNPRYFLALRRTEEGTLYFAKIDQINSTDTIQINIPGPNSGNYEDFEYGVDFFDGRAATDHSRPYANLFYDQYRWDDKNIFYYIDSEGGLVVRVNQSYSYS